ncbi:MAG: class I adenylate-forming enzyme family protein [Ilumatobacteraceae bacterium]
MLETLWDVFRRSLVTNGPRPALSVGDTTWTYDDLSTAVAVAAGKLADAGVVPGDRVILLCDNSAAFPIHDLAIMALGAVKVPLNSMLTAAEIGDIARRVRPRAAVVTASLDHLATDLPAECALIAGVTVDPGHPAIEPPPLGACGPDDLAFVGFTGGTTGKPKGIVHRQHPFVLNMFAHIVEGSIGPDERLLLTTPLPHAAGLFALAGLMRGAHVRVEPTFDAEGVLRTMEAEGITWTFAVPTMIYRMLDAAEATGIRPASLRTIQYGAAPISPERLRQAIGLFGPVLQQLYAQTECPNFATSLTKADHVRALDEPALLSSCGRSTLMCEVAVIDENGNEVATGEVGEVALRSPYTMAGYWEDPDGYASRFARGWMRTGDVGRLDAEGFLTLVDRRNDMIISGGMNVYSVEVENVIAAHPSVGQVAVVAVPHPDWGEAVHAVIVPALGATPDTDDLAAYCREHLAAYKRPKAFEVVAELPLTVYGKVDKKALRAPHWVDVGRNVG